MMKASEFVEKCKEISKMNTVYMWGTFGSVVTDKLIDQKAKQFPDWYEGKVNELIKHKGEWAFDCVGLIKGILWGWNGDTSKSYGGAEYNSNNLVDCNANMMINKCENVSYDFTNIEKGEVVWIQGHIGVYIGDGLVVECTPVADNGVQVTALLNHSAKRGYNSRRWSKHGKLPWVDYNEIPVVIQETPVKKCMIMIDGKQKKLDCVNVDGHNYIKVRDLAPLLNYNVSAKGNMPILTKKD